MKACFAQSDRFDNRTTKENARASYFKQTDKKYSMIQMLTAAFIICQHQNDEAQCDEFWLLCNPALDDYVCAEAVAPFLVCLIETAVEATSQRLASFLAEMASTEYVHSQSLRSLRYMDQVRACR